MEPRAGVTKQDIREKIWDYMESQNLADFPRPVHHRIPNFKGSYVACEKIKELEAFARTWNIKVGPDKPLEGVRLLALQSHKTLLVPTPRLRTGLFNKIIPPPGATKDILRKCATSQGVKNYSVPIGLDSRVLVDLVIVGSVAVSEQGWRIGKGEGYADLEYAMMVSMGAVREETPVVTVVHDCQVVDIPEALIEDHDLTVDYVLTPTRVITTGCRHPKPKGITWCKVPREYLLIDGTGPDKINMFRSPGQPRGKISAEMLERIPVLRSLRYREQQAGKDVTLQGVQQHLWEAGSKHVAPLRAVQRLQDDPQRTEGGVPAACSSLHREGSPPDVLASPSVTVHVGHLPAGVRVSELKRAIRERGATPLRLTWQGPQRSALLDYRDLAEAERAITCLQGLCLGASTLRIELAK